MCDWSEGMSTLVDCQKCSCSGSSATHTPTIDPEDGRQYCTTCGEYC